jgi:uncharacterized membrane protein YhhN
VGKLGWFDRWFCSPSNHRVHHAVNDAYIDKNYGGILVIWDRLFGSFQEEREPCVYGTRSALNSWDPVWANMQVYWALAQASWREPRWLDKLRVWLMPPGWQSSQTAGLRPQPPFQLAAVATFNPPMDRSQQWFTALQFLMSLGAVSLLLWHADSMPIAEAAIWVAALSAALWAIGLHMQGRLAMLEVLMLQSGVIATLGGLGMLGMHMVFKPLTMLIAIFYVANESYKSRATKQFDIKDVLLLGALACSLAGDVFLMLPGNYFVPGLASFLLAHVFYITLLRQQTPWFANRGALGIVLAVGLVMYGVVFKGLDNPVLAVAVAVYVAVISLMAAQAIGRATVVADSPSRWVAAGACIFMLSDAIIAINKFVAPVPLAPLWILSSYYAAQMLIVHNVRPRIKAN